MRSLVRVALATFALLLVPASALGTTRTAHKGKVTATLSFTGSDPRFYNVRLRIARAGTVVYDAPVRSSPNLCGSNCRPGGVHVLGLEPGHEPDVLLDLYTGGSHCCSFEQVFRFQGGRYVKTERNFADAGVQVKDLAHNGRLEFLTADDRFAYQFASFATSGLPVQVLVFRAGHFKNVTREYPTRIKRDASVWWKAFSHNHYGEGFIAAWAADEDLLGHYSQVAKTLNAQAAAGHLHSDSSGPEGHKFVTALQKFLHRLGYRP